ncbi:MAG TPA: hypothetical protein VH560_00710 [Polyangia bacterium]|jgi:hypothetical protein|nr:hypothetical protein [Polyangia bacterium]
MLATLTASLIAGGARAAPDHGAADRDASPIALVWAAPAGCPSSAEISRELARVARAPAGKTLPHLTVDARVEPRGERWVLHLRTVRDGVEGERELEAESCASLARAATLVVALALGVGGDELGAAPPPPAPEEPRPRTPPRPRVVEAPPSAPVAPLTPVAPAPLPPVAPTPVAIVVARPSVAPPRFAWILAADASATRGPLPGTSFGAAFGVDAGRGRFFASLRLEAWLPEDEATAAAGVRARYTGVGGALAGCAVAAHAGRFTLAGCVGVRAAALHGASSGALVDRDATAPLYAIVPALRSRTRLARAFFVDVGVELGVSLDQPRFALLDLGDIYEVPRLVPAATLGFAFDL